MNATRSITHMFGVYTRNDETKANKREATLTRCKTNVPPSTLLFEIVRNTWHEINTNTLDPTLFFLLLLLLLPSLRLFRCSISWKRRERERERNKLSRGKTRAVLWRPGTLVCSQQDFWNFDPGIARGIPLSVSFEKITVRGCRGIYQNYKSSASQPSLCPYDIPLEIMKSLDVYRTLVGSVSKYFLFFPLFGFKMKYFEFRKIFEHFLISKSKGKTVSWLENLSIIYYLFGLFIYFVEFRNLMILMSKLNKTTKLTGANVKDLRQQ